MSELRDYVDRCRGALTALDNLGSVDAIADHLGTLGIKGRPGHATDCPVANYVRLTCPSDSYRFCARRWGWHVNDEDEMPIHDERDAIPEHVQAFICRFDDDGDSFPGLRKSDD